MHLYLFFFRIKLLPIANTPPFQSTVPKKDFQFLSDEDRDRRVSNTKKSDVLLLTASEQILSILCAISVILYILAGPKEFEIINVFMLDMVPGSLYWLTVITFYFECLYVPLHAENTLYQEYHILKIPFRINCLKKSCASSAIRSNPRMRRDLQTFYFQS